MKYLIAGLTLMIYCSCTSTILLEAGDNVSLSNSIDARNNNRHFENIDWNISSSNQTKSYIVMNINIQNDSNQDLDFHPLDFYYSHSRYFHRIHALDPFYIDHKIKHPLSTEYAPDLPAKNAIIYEDLKYIIRNNRIRKELEKINGDAVLQPQKIAPGATLEGQLIFPKVYMKKLNEVNIKWRYNEACLGKQLKVL